MTLDQTSLHYAAVYDELSADGVTPRPHWEYLMESLREIGPEELGRAGAVPSAAFARTGSPTTFTAIPSGQTGPGKPISFRC